MEKAEIINESIAKEKKEEYKKMKAKKKNEKKNAKNEKEHKKRLEKLKFSLDNINTMIHIFSENHFIK